MKTAKALLELGACGVGEPFWLGLGKSGLQSHHQSTAGFYLVGFRKSWQRGCPPSHGGQCLFAWEKMSLIICPPWSRTLKLSRRRFYDGKLPWSQAALHGGLLGGEPQHRCASGDNTRAETQARQEGGRR